MKTLLVLPLALALAATTASESSPLLPTPSPPTWTLLPTNTHQQFRGLSAISATTAWAAGTNTTVLRTTDSGATWTSVGPALPPNSTLEFRDIEAFSALRAVVLSIGEGAASRIYTTDDGGVSWSNTFTNPDAAAFYDCLAFNGPLRGMAVSDPVGGKFRLIETRDGGASWDVVPSDGMPAALPGEFGFAASGTCLATQAGRWYLASGGVGSSRVFRSADDDDGLRWDVAESGIFRDRRHGIAVGGDYTVPNARVNVSSWTADGGETWVLSREFPGGYRSGSAWVPGRCGTAVAVGPTGSDFTVDGGRTWRGFDVSKALQELQLVWVFMQCLFTSSTGCLSPSPAR
ncbi:oxidoreductase [Podospora appendiculata]|uniref:Oxidoreductase n=1 Tax=Podospora appendiculata TaxID=314037 RepID=A0AAE0XGX9_9PEZI|nr:oxidoreductase [Podospora appendiculata]